MSDTLVNSVYPVSYFSLPGVDKINYPDNFWWSSKLRYAALDLTGFNYLPAARGGVATSEILELDLGRVREINYLNLDVLRAPIDIKIEYDAISSPDRDAAWLPVQPIDGQAFDHTVGFDSNNRTSWLNAEFNFTDAKANMVHTRYLRITFTRRDEPWPTNTSAAFAWPVFVKHLRLGRYITGLQGTVGPLLSQDTPLDMTPVTLASPDNVTTREARQQFVIPATSVRAGQTPNMLGFGVLIETSTSPDDLEQGRIDRETSYGWSVWDVTLPTAPVRLRYGVENVAVAPGLSWLDWYLDDAAIIPGDTTKVYELRIFSRNVLASNTIFTHGPNDLSNRAVPGTVTFTNGSSAITTSVDTTGTVHVGDYIVRSDIPEQVFRVNAVTGSTITINVAYSNATLAGATATIVFPYSAYDPDSADYVQDATKNLVARVWADTADEGRDVLGNSYRYVSRRQQAAFVHDIEQAGWMSDPAPSPDAVEALYFDVRGADPATSTPVASIIEALQVAPRTPGVRMNVYYTDQNLNGEAPVTTNDWDYLLWTPVQETYTLRRHEIIQLPHPIRAAFIKLEFTALNPLPYRLPTFPALPPKLYRRFPTWVEDQFNNSLVRNVVEDWFLRNATPVETKILKSMSDPVLEFQYKQREFLAALALGKIVEPQVVNSGVVDVANKAIIDPTTASKIFVSFDNQFQNTLLLSVSPDSVLGQMVIQRFDPTTITDPNERAARTILQGDVPLVSTTNDRISESYQNLAQVPMRFNKTTRHIYTQSQAEFNKKAYFVGIEKVRFLRNNYTVRYDDALIPDDLYDDQMLVEDTFMREESTQIPDGSTLYVSYSINPDIVDEAVFLSGNAPVELAVGGAPARNVLVYSLPSKQGLQFFQGQDFELSYGTDADGNRVTFIQRSAFGARLTVPLNPVVYVDAGTVAGRSVIPNPSSIDSDVVIGVAVISAADEGPLVPNYGTGRYGSGTYGNLLGGIPLVDRGTVTGVANIQGTDFFTGVDAAVVVGVTMIGDPITDDIQTVTGRSAISAAVEARDSVDAGTVVGHAIVTTSEASVIADAARVVGTSIISAAFGGVYTDTGFVQGIGRALGSDGGTFSGEVMLDGPSHFWKLWDASGIVAVDASGNGRNGAYVNAPALHDASILDLDPAAKSVALNGSNQYITRGYEASINPATWCAEIVFKLSGGAGTFRAIATTRDEVSGVGWLLYVSDTNKLQLRMQDTIIGTVIIDGATTISVGSPYHAVVGFDGANAFVYLNGSLETGPTGLPHYTGPSTSGLRIGSRMDGAFWFPGSVQGFAHYAYMLNPTRIASHYVALTT